MNPYSRSFNVERYVVNKVGAERGIGRQAARELQARGVGQTRSSVRALGFQSQQIDPDTARALLMMVGR